MPRPQRQLIPSTGPVGSHSVRWTGAVVRVFNLLHQGKPMRVAAWMTHELSLACAAIVEGNGNAVLRQLLDEEIARLPPERRPTELVVWPSAKAAVRGSSLPVTIQKNEFVRVILDDMSCAGTLRREIPVRAA